MLAFQHLLAEKIASLAEILDIFILMSIEKFMLS